MNWIESKKLREQLYKIKEDMQAMVSKSEAENRDMSTEEDNKFRSMHVEGEQIQKRIERAETVEKFTASNLDKSDHRIGRSDSAPAEVRAALKGKDEVDAFRIALLTGDNTQLRALSSTTANAGYETIPTTTATDIIAELKNFGGMRSVARVLPTPSGEPMNWPLFSDTGNLATIKAESETVADNVDPTFDSVALNVTTLHSGIIRVPIQFLQDSVMMESFLNTEIVKRLGRKGNRLYTQGNAGADVVLGILNAAPRVSAASITYDNLVDFKLSVDAEYRTNAKWMISDEALKDLKKLVDGDGRLVWQPNLSVGAPTQIDGQDYVVNNDMTNDLCVAYGDWSYYVIRDAPGIGFQRLNELYAASLQVGIHCWMRTGGNLLYKAAVNGTNSPVKVLDLVGS